MKWLRIICIIFLSLVTVSGSEESESLRAILDKSITPGELHEDILEQSLATWSGLKSIAGIEAVYDLRINTTRGFEKLAGGFISKRFEVPRSEVTTFLLGKCDQSKNDVYLLMRYLDYLSDYDDDVRVPKYYASLLSDKRQQNRNLRPMDGCDVVRVCDISVKNLTYWAEKHTSLKMGDPAFVWDALHVADFDKNIAAIRPYLIAQGVIEYSKKSSPDFHPHQKSEPGPGDPGNSRQVKDGVPGNKETANVPAGGIETGLWRVIAFGAGVVCFLILLWLYLGKRGRHRS